jgi:two-component system, NtrC family, sensor kinase
LQAETNAYPESSELARRDGHRTLLAVPLLHAVDAIGAITIRRTEVRLFSDKQIALLETFADQAVIAIENTRLFEAEQESKQRTPRGARPSNGHERSSWSYCPLAERPPSDLQPVLETLAGNCSSIMRLL